jgi:hypothetical protein
MIVRYRWLWIGCGILLLAPSATEAQRKVTTRKEKPKAKTTQFVGVMTSFNNLTGPLWEFQVTTKKQKTSRNTVTLVGGYSSRWETFKSDTVGRSSSREWIHGIGGAAMLNHYSEKIGPGLVWSLGVSGNIYFRDQRKLKTLSVFGLVAYRTPVGSRSMVAPHIGFGLMGSPFASTSSSDINGAYILAGCSWVMKL